MRCPGRQGKYFATAAAGEQKREAALPRRCTAVAFLFFLFFLSFFRMLKSNYSPRARARARGCARCNTIMSNLNLAKSCESRGKRDVTLPRRLKAGSRVTSWKKIRTESFCVTECIVRCSSLSRHSGQIPLKRAPRVLVFASCFKSIGRWNNTQRDGETLKCYWKQQRERNIKYNEFVTFLPLTSFNSQIVSDYFNLSG